MSHKKFDEFIEEQSQKAQMPEVDRHRRLAEFQNHLEEFYKKIGSFLKSYIEKKQIRIKYEKKKIFEDFIGEYQAKIAIIELGNNSIRLDPIGTIIIGAKGRIDMTGPNGVITFLLVSSDATISRIEVRIYAKGEVPCREVKEAEVEHLEWKIATPPPRIQFLPLTEESFLDALMVVTNAAAS